ncbi:BirA family transcriptional regulator, biotin operon repressor / biotin---[acetyl-CoA-carboxylase] ligase [Nematocida parisii]|uniref:Biotin-[acetyl-CoA-carboxylase] ligase n=1 Tax=Nematocida parisii (strain ERTm3) TaxID=935791 RepID=I3EJY6_NEMP3|nr:biotin-[acetyl-CoA-carboxylase] ligase [Nematocida parisii ERTm3]KAI5157857.1 BirA family transcriptional regulator, biotin operon repressor / biotin---[acetyl-CoA-carboxylase] ligase [Nematocida parisii]
MHIIKLDTLPSTQLYCLERVNDLPIPSTVITDKQTHGIGRSNSNWVSSEGSLTFSIIIDIKNNLKNASLITSSVIKSVLIKNFNISGIEIKWPNDLIIKKNEKENKVAGVLVNYVKSSSNTELAIIGVGINLIPCNNKSIHYKTIKDLTNKNIDKNELFKILITEIEKVFYNKNFYENFYNWTDYFPYNYVIYNGIPCEILRVDDDLYVKYKSETVKLQNSLYSYNRTNNTIYNK